MKTLPSGTGGTLGVQYAPTTLATPRGTLTTVVASAQGSTVDSSAASASTTLTTAATTVTSAVSGLQPFTYEVASAESAALF